VNALAEPLTQATRVVALTEAVELNPRPDRAALADDLEVSFVPMAAVEAGSGRLDATAIRRFGEVKKGYTTFREGDVLFAKITPCMENGKMAVACGLRNGIGCGSTEFHVLRPRPGVHAHYVYHFVSSARFRSEAGHHMTGAVGQKRVPAAFLERCVIPLPGLNEQRRIVAEIEKQFSRLDEAVANLKRVKANLKRQRSAILKVAVEGTLIPGNKPGTWKREQIGTVGAVISGLTKNPKRQQLPRKMPYLRVANVYANELRLDDVEEIGVAHSEVEKLLVKRGDLLVVEGNGSPDQIGRVALWDGSIPNCVHQNHLIKVRFGEDVLPEWAMTWLLSPGGRREIEQVSSSTSGLHTLSTGKVARLPLPLPPLAEQRHIVAEVDRRLSIVHEVEAEVDANLKRAQALRQAVLGRAFAAANQAN
jgi:type I restriction enzyme S subunit